MPAITLDATLETRVATGAWITPLAAPGSALYELHTNLRSDDNADAANTVSTALSPDGSTLLILTSGYNTSFSKEDGTPIVYPVLDPQTGLPTSNTTGNAEWLFVYDVTGPKPVQKQKFNLPRTYVRVVVHAEVLHAEEIFDGATPTLSSRIPLATFASR